MRNLILALAGVMIAFSPLSVSAEASLSERLAGYILLQVEGHGEAWYVNPTDNVRYYMKDGPTAYEMMREFGLGISETDFATLEAGDEDIAERVAGHIVLRVEKHGEAYYINPADHSLTYLKDGEAAYGVMRAQSLGITDEDLSDVPSGTIESNISSIVLEDTETESETVIIHEIIHQPIIVYVEQEEATEEVEVVEEPEDTQSEIMDEAPGLQNVSLSFDTNDAFNTGAGQACGLDIENYPLSEGFVSVSSEPSERGRGTVLATLSFEQSVPVKEIKIMTLGDASLDVLDFNVVTTAGIEVPYTVEGDILTIGNDDQIIESYGYHVRFNPEHMVVGETIELQIADVIFAQESGFDLPAGLPIAAETPTVITGCLDLR